MPQRRILSTGLHEWGAVLLGIAPEPPLAAGEAGASPAPPIGGSTFRGIEFSELLHWCKSILIPYPLGRHAIASCNR